MCKDGPYLIEKKDFIINILYQFDLGKVSIAHNNNFILQVDFDSFESAFVF